MNIVNLYFRMYTFGLKSKVKLKNFSPQIFPNNSYWASVLPPLSLPPGIAEIPKQEKGSKKTNNS